MDGRMKIKNVYESFYYAVEHRCYRAARGEDSGWFWPELAAEILSLFIPPPRYKPKDG